MVNHLLTTTLIETLTEAMPEEIVEEETVNSALTLVTDVDKRVTWLVSVVNLIQGNVKMVESLWNASDVTKRVIWLRIALTKTKDLPKRQMSVLNVTKKVIWLESVQTRTMVMLIEAINANAEMMVAQTKEETQATKVGEKTKENPKKLDGVVKKNLVDGVISQMMRPKSMKAGLLIKQVIASLAGSEVYFIKLIF